MKRLWLVVSAAAALLVLAVPFAGAGTIDGPPVSGERVGMLTSAYPANTPFYVRHGFVSEPQTGENRGEVMRLDAVQEVLADSTHFDLYVDGTLAESATDLEFTDQSVAKWGLTNFRKGLPAGIHTFRGEWYSLGELVMTRTWQVTFFNADIIFFRGTVLTMDPAQPQAEAVAVHGDEIVAVGDEKAVLRLRGEETRMVDLGGRTLLPGFNDAHAHWIGNPGFAGETQEQSIAAALRGGFTSVSELFVTADRLATLQALSDEGKLPFRVNAYLAVNSRGLYAEKYGIWFSDYTQGQVLGPHLRIGGVKIFADGWLLSQPFLDRPGDYYGRTWWTQEELNTIVQQLAEGGWQIATHAEGDAGIDLILNAYKTVLQGADNDRRFRIEHLDVLRDDQIAALKQYGILASIQLPWYTSFAPPPEPTYEDVLGPDRLPWVARWHDLVEAGVKIVGSTDQPWSACFSEPCTAPRAIYAAVTRTGFEGLTPPQYMLDQRITVEQAVEAMTSAGAYATFEEDTKGTISVHKLADLVVLDHNPLLTAPDELDDIAVLATIVGGHTEYCATGATPLCP